MYFKFVFLAAGLMLLAGCAGSPQPTQSTEEDTQQTDDYSRVQPVHNIIDAPIISGSGKKLALAQVEHAIRAAATYKRWNVQRIGDGHLQAFIHVRRHYAKVDITFSSSAYSIKYLDSKVLRYNGKYIHRNYNKWIKLMARKIEGNLSAL